MKSSKGKKVSHRKFKLTRCEIPASVSNRLLSVEDCIRLDLISCTRRQIFHLILERVVINEDGFVSILIIRQAENLQLEGRKVPLCWWTPRDESDLPASNRYRKV